MALIRSTSWTSNVIKRNIQKDRCFDNVRGHLGSRDHDSRIVSAAHSAGGILGAMLWEASLQQFPPEERAVNEHNGKGKFRLTEYDFIR